MTRADRRRPVQARFVLQVRLPDRTVQLRRLDLSPFEVKVRDQDDLHDAAIRRTAFAADANRSSDLVVIRGCELALFQPRKVGNMDCTFCLDCVHACPHDNVGILSRLPGSELLTDPLRSGIGYFSKRKDLAALAIVFTFRRAAERVWHGQPRVCGRDLARPNACTSATRLPCSGRFSLSS